MEKDMPITTMGEPIKMNVPKKQLEMLLEFCGDDNLIVVEMTPTGLGWMYRASKEWDGEFEDVTDIDSF